MASFSLFFSIYKICDSSHVIHRSHITSPSPYGTLNNMNKMHGSISKLPSVNQLVTQQTQQSAGPSASMSHMGKLLHNQFISNQLFKKKLKFKNYFIWRLFFYPLK